MTSLTIEPRKTALVLIDLQQGVVGRPAAPRSGPEAVHNAARLASRFRQLGAPVVLVRVAFHPDFKDFLAPPADSASPFNASRLPPNWAELVPEVGPQPGDLIITKRQWGAFHGTELDLQLRAATCGPSFSAGSRPTSASSPPREVPMSTGTPRSSPRTPWPAAAPRRTRSRLSTSLPASGMCAQPTRSSQRCRNESPAFNCHPSGPLGPGSPAAAR